MTFLIMIFAALTLGGAIAAMTLRNLVHCALALTVAFAGFATLYLSLDAEFAGLAQLLVYVGAVAILIVFAILLTPDSLRAGENPGRRRSPSGIVGAALAAGVFATLAYSVTHSSMARSGVSKAPPAASVRQIGESLVTRYILPVEVLGLMLTAALIGAVILAVKESQSPR